MTNKTCKFCSTHFTGRRDKIFCSSKCKTYYHRDLNSKAIIAGKDVTKILIRNRSILFELLGENGKQKKVNRILLDKKKFNWQHYTSIHINTRNKIVYYVYDIAWMQFSDQEVLIKKLVIKNNPSKNTQILESNNIKIKSELKCK